MHGDGGKNKEPIYDTLLRRIWNRLGEFMAREMVQEMGTLPNRMGKEWRTSNGIQKEYTG